MSEDQIEIVRRAFLAMDEGVEEMLAYTAEDFVMVTPSSLAAEPDTYRGHDGVRRWFDSFYEAVDEIRITPGRVEQVGEHVLAEFNMRTRGRTTGLEASQAAVGVGSVAEGKVTRLEFFATWDEALAAIDD